MFNDKQEDRRRFSWGFPTGLAVSLLVAWVLGVSPIGGRGSIGHVVGGAR